MSTTIAQDQAQESVLADMQAGAAALAGAPAQPVIPTADFAEGFDFFSEFGGGLDSGIEDLYRRKFAAGFNKDCRFQGLTFEATETFKVVKAKFMNDDQWVEEFGIFVPEARETVDENGQKRLTWYPETMRDTAGMPILDNANAKYREWGGVPDLDANGRRQKLPNGDTLYRNETEQEAMKRKLNDFRRKLNSFIAAFCKENMAEAMQFIVAQGAVKGWEDYMNRVQGAIVNFEPSFAEKPVTLKLHRRYDKTTSNKCSERYFELPKDMSYGLFLEQEVEGVPSVLTITSHEQKRKIDAPKEMKPQAGINSPGGASPAASPAAARPMGGLNPTSPMGAAIPKASAMPTPGLK